MRDQVAAQDTGAVAHRIAAFVVAAVVAIWTMRREVARDLGILVILRNRGIDATETALAQYLFAIALTAGGPVVVVFRRRANLDFVVILATVIGHQE